MSKTQVVQYMPDVMPGGDLAIPPSSDDSIEWRVRVVSRGGVVTSELTWVVNEWLESGSMAYAGDEPVIVPEPEEAAAIQQTRAELERLLDYSREVHSENEVAVFTEPTPEQIKCAENSGIRVCDTCGQLTLVGFECRHEPVNPAVIPGTLSISIEPASARILPIDKMTRVDALDTLVTLLGGAEEVGKLIGRPESYVRSWSNGAQPENAVTQTLIDTVASRFRAVTRKRSA